MDGYLFPQEINNHEQIIEILGHNWLKTQVDAALNRDGIKNPLHPSKMSPTFGWISHPLISELKRYYLDGHQTLVLDSVERDIKTLVNTNLPLDLGRRLRDAHDFSKVAYEMQIAAGFKRLGYSPEWCPPIQQPHPEFFVTLNDSQTLAVECKKRDAIDGYEQEADRFWKHIQYSLREKMKVERLNYWVKISGREFHLEDINHLVEEIISVIKVSKMGQFSSDLGRYQIEYTWLTEPDGSIPTEVVNLFPRGVRGINEGTQNKNQILTGPLTNPRLLRLEFTDDPEHRIKGLIRNLKIASKQMSQGMLNIIYIDINMKKYIQEQAEFEDMRQAIINELSVRYRHVSAVVLTNIYPTISMDKQYIWRVRTALIEQTKPTSKLPNNLKIPGDILDTQWLPGNMALPSSIIE